MRCPICGAKMVQNQLCQYCNITDEQVLNASNKKVSEYRKRDMKDLIHFTNIVPKDVSRFSLLMYTIFLGLIGVNHYYVKRNVRGTFGAVSTGLCLLVFILGIACSFLWSSTVFRVLYELIFYIFIINIILWISDIVNVIIKTFKIPVVLAEKGETRK